MEDEVLGEMAKARAPGGVTLADAKNGRGDAPPLGEKRPSSSVPSPKSKSVSDSVTSGFIFEEKACFIAHFRHSGRFFGGHASFFLKAHTAQASIELRHETRGVYTR
jgi:hypothetical protein